MFTTKKLKVMVPNASRLIRDAFTPRQPAVALACREAAYPTQAMNAQVSFGSQPQ